MTDALIAEMRRAQVVRDGGEERRAQLVRRGDRARRLGLRLELAEVDRGRELAGEGVEHALVLAADRRPGEREHVVGVELDRGGARLGTLGNAVAARGLDPPAALVAVENRRSLEPEHAAEPVEHRRDGRGAGEPGERLRLGAGARPLGRPAGGERDEARHDRADGEEDEEREHVLGLGDRERVVAAG